MRPIPTPPRVVSMLLAAALLLPATPAPAALPVAVVISDPSGDEWHVHDQPDFAVGVSVGDAPREAFLYQWRDYGGRALSPWAALPAEPLRCPAPPLAFYDLALRCQDDRYSLPLRQPGETRLYGFAVMPRRIDADRARDDSAHLGIVHLPIDASASHGLRSNPYFSGWCKTLEWTAGNGDAAAWKTAIQQRLDLRLKELPIVIGGPWTKVDDARPASRADLRAIYDLARDRLAQEAACTDATGPPEHFWELGLEESGALVDDKRPHYLANLHAKARQFRQAAEDLKIADRLHLLWQDVEWDGTTLADRFLASDAARDFDILAVHPYAWQNGKPDYPDPDTWLPALLTGLKAAMQAHGQVKPVWFTEIGQPVQYNYPTPEFGGTFETNRFGYPDGQGGYKKNGWPVYDNGVAREHSGAYLTKLCTLAFRGGVEKIFWYNYRDGGRDPCFAEDNFGLFDADVFPKPAFAAYRTVAVMLGNRPVNTTGSDREVAAHVAAPVRAYDYAPGPGSTRRVLVAWTEDGSAQALRFDDLRAGRDPVVIQGVHDLVGSEKPVPGDGVLPLAADPIYVEYQPARPSATAPSAP